MSLASLPEVVQNALARGTTVLTAGQRGAHTLRAASLDGDPAIYAVDTWMSRLWTEMTVSGTARRMLLNRSQEQVLWQRAVAEDAEVSALRSVDSLAEMAASAYRTLLLHNGRGLLATHAETTDNRAFLRWTDSFERQLGLSKLCTAAHLPGLLREAVGRGELPVGKEGVLLLDFDALVPALDSLFEALRQAGYPVRSAQTAVQNPRVGLLAAEDTAAEYEQAAFWLKEWLDRDPTARLALVVPDLAQSRPALERILQRVLAAGQAGLGHPASALPYEFSLGTPLAETSAGTTALALMRLAQGPQSLPTVSGLLLDPWFGAGGSPDEQLAVAEFDAYVLRGTRRLRPQLSLAGLERALARSPYADRTPRLLGNLRAMSTPDVSEQLANPQVRQTHARWADRFRAVLHAAGWHETAMRDSLAFQVHRRFESALDELSTLDFDGSRVTAAEALHSLTSIAQSTIFAPESHAAAVQVMGPLEPGALPFDGLWFVGAGDLGWPVPATSNPLLPRSLLRLLHVPGSWVQDDHEAAAALTRRLAGSALQATFSYSKLADGQHQRAAPVLGEIDTVPVNAWDPPVPQTPVPMEQVPDMQSRIALPDEVLRGGAGILEHQAACAFRAFAQYRLGSTELARQESGLDPGERGSLVHMVMQLFWEELADQRELRALSSAERAGLLEDCIVRALRDTMREAESGWDRAYLHTQHLRLRNLLTPWIDQELARPAFAVRTSERTLDDARLGPLRLRLRVDRIDETEGGEVILDYKTGHADPKQWRSERPDKPQLPLYAVLAEEPVSGIAFAMLRPGKELDLRGFADSADLFGAKPAAMDTSTFAEQLERWKAVLLELAQGFADGRAEVDPKEYPQTCRVCAHRVLCRVDPGLLADGPEDADEEYEQVHG